ncbi:MAG: response regulator [Anaerolineae bacterium]|nr:response regulator [Anaerolineae bacterium]
MSQQNRASILVVAKDQQMRHALIDTLEEAGGHQTVAANTFEEALSEILLRDFDLILTEAELPDLSGMDLLAVVSGLRPNARVIVIDDELSAKSAVAVFRLGAADYLYKPLNMTFALMQVERQLAQKRAEENQPEPQNNARSDGKKQAPAKHIDPTARPAALVLGREQFKQIEIELNRLLSHVKASFAGLVDTEGNMMGAAGTLDAYDLQVLTRALNIDHSAQQSLAKLLDENKFHSTYFEGDQNGVYIIEFGTNFTVSLAVICGHQVKPGMVWLYSKRTAAIIDDILKSVPKPRNFPRLQQDG